MFLKKRSSTLFYYATKISRSQISAVGYIPLRYVVTGVILLPEQFPVVALISCYFNFNDGFISIQYSIHAVNYFDRRRIVFSV